MSWVNSVLRQFLPYDPPLTLRKLPQDKRTQLVKLRFGWTLLPYLYWHGNILYRRQENVDNKLGEDIIPCRYSCLSALSRFLCFLISPPRKRIKARGKSEVKSSPSEETTQIRKGWRPPVNLSAVAFIIWVVFHLLCSFVQGFSFYNLLSLLSPFTFFPPSFHKLTVRRRECKWGES